MSKGYKKKSERTKLKQLKNKISDAVLYHRQNNACPKMSIEPWNILHNMAKEIKVGDRSKVSNQLTSDIHIIMDL